MGEGPKEERTREDKGAGTVCLRALDVVAASQLQPQHLRNRQVDLPSSRSARTTCLTQKKKVIMKPALLYKYILIYMA